MTFYNEKEFNKSPPADFSGKWAFECLEGCFGGKIKVTDIDGIVERKGQFLVIETKAPGIEIPKGQQILFDQLLATKVFAVVFVWGKPGVSPIERILLFYRNAIKEIPPTLDALKDICSRWYKWADRSGLRVIKKTDGN